MSEWREIELGEVLTLQRGFDLPAQQRVDGPFPIVSSSGLTGSHVDFKVHPPGVVIGRTGTLGSVFWIHEPFWPLNTSLWVKDFKGNDPRFVSYLLKTVTVDGSTASAVPGVNRNHLHKLRVRRPSPAVQRRIAAVLSAFDELIGINERRITLLEELARSLYREWFVHFRFPGHEDVEFVDSELGAIPEGWEVRCLADLASTVVDGVDTAEVNSATPYVGLEHLPRRHTTLREWGSIHSVTSRKLRFARGDTLFGKIRPYFHKVVWMPFDGVASSDSIVIRPLEHLRATALVNAVGSSDALVGEAVATSNGTKMPRADPKALLGYPMALPVLSDELIAHFEQAAGGYLQTAAELSNHNRAFAATRDLLLPRLVTGRLDISDVDLGDLLPDESE